MSPRLPTESLFSIRLDTWRALFAARGYPPPLSATTFGGASLATVADALARPDLPLPLCRIFSLCPSRSSRP